MLSLPSVMELQILSTLITFLIFLFFIPMFLKLLKTHTNRKQKFPPGPLKLPVIGSILSLASCKLPHHNFSDLARKYGPIMHLQLGEISAIVISSPQLAKEVYKTQGTTFAGRPNLLAPEIAFYNNSDIAFAPYGAYWRQLRKLCSLELLSTKKVQELCFSREDEVKLFIESIQSSSGSAVNITEKIYKLSSSIIARAVFGESCRDQETVIKAISDLTYFAAGFNVADLFPSSKLLRILSGIRPKLLKLREKVGKIIDDYIVERLEKQTNTNGGNSRSEDEDLLDVLLRIKATGGLKFPITSNNIKSVILEMFAAGSDTSSTLLEWAMSEMIRNPRAMHKAQDGLRQALNGKRTMSEIDIQGLPYLKLIIKEALRLHPPAPLLGPRECSEACVVEGYDVPIKTKLLINAWAMGRDPEYWHDAENFVPERFENNSTDFRGADFEYIPFGAGKRICPGITFGLAMVELPLAQLLYHFDWKLPGNTKLEDLDMTEGFGLTARRKNSLVLIATPRNPPVHSCS